MNIYKEDDKMSVQAQVKQIIIHTALRHVRRLEVCARELQDVIDSSYIEEIKRALIEAKENNNKE